jgi:ADP-Ribosyltransferase in polyvalent proteins
MTEVLYHGSKNSFSSLRPSVSGVRGRGIFFSDSIKYARVFGDFVHVCEIALDNPKVYATSADFVVDEMMTVGGAEGLTRKLAEDGFDGVVIECSKVSTGTVREVVCFDPENITRHEIVS